MTLGPQAREGVRTLERAERALREGDVAEAAALYAQAAALLDARAVEGLRLHAFSRGALCEQLLGRVGPAEEALHAAAELARRRGDRRRLAGVLGQLGLAAAHRGAPGEAAGFHHEALALARDLGDDAAIANHAGNLGLLASARGALGEARERFQEALTRFAAVGDVDGAANALNSLGEVERARGVTDAAEDAFREALRLWRTTGSQEGQGLALSNLGNVARVEGRYGEAHELFHEALELARQGGHARAEARARTNLGIVAAARGRRAEAREHYLASAAIHERLGFVAGLAVDRANLGNLAAEEGRLAEARTLFERARGGFDKAGQARSALDCRCLVAQLDARLGRLDEAEVVFREARVEAARLGHEDGEDRAAANLAAISYARGDVSRAAEEMVAVMDRFQERGRLPEALTTALGAVEVLVAAGRPGEARELLDRARGAAQGSGEDRFNPLLRALSRWLDFSEEPGDSGARALLAAAAELAHGGRTLEALEHRLVAAEWFAGKGERPSWMGDLVRDAEALGAAGLTLEARSTALLGAEPSRAGAAVAELARLAGEARELGLRLLALRVARRRGVVAARAGDPEIIAEGRASCRAARDEALALGAVWEAGRLEAVLEALGTS